MKQTTTRLGFVLLLLLLSTRANANPILYTFTTNGNVAGSFALDDSIPFTVTSQGAFTSAGFSPTPFMGYSTKSPVISGTFGSFIFSGSSDCCGIPNGLDILDYEPPYDSAIDQAKGDWWILRSFVSGPAIDGRSVTYLSIFDYVGPSAISGPSFSPPPPLDNATDFQYAIGFSDGATESGPLKALARIPETTSLIFLSIALGGIVFLKPKYSGRT